MERICDNGCGAVATHRWEGKALCWPCKQPLLNAAARLSVKRLAADHRFQRALSEAAGVRVTIVDGDSESEVRG